MRRSTRFSGPVTAAVAGLLLSAFGRSYAQSLPAGVIAGVVSDSAGAPIAGAEVSLVGTGPSVRTDDRGRFRISSPLGPISISARRLGFAQVTTQVELKSSSDATTVYIQMRPLPTVLQQVVVKANKVNYTGRLAGYYQRLEARNGGYFISRDQIDRENPRLLSQLLTHVPGVNAIRMRSGGGGVRMRGRNCWPLVWLDGLPMGAAEVDLDAFPPNTIHGIELYLGSTTAPMRYIATRDMSSCGTILLWSRGPDTDPLASPRAPRFDLQRMVASLSVYTADQVDQPASQDPAHRMTVEYPPASFAAGIGGSVTAEFVVDAAGRVEEGTFGIVSSTDPVLSEAVRRAVEPAIFKPAILHGTAVRQVVTQPFLFPAREGKSSRN